MSETETRPQDRCIEIRTWRIGAVRVACIFEQHLLDIETLIPGATQEVLKSAAWLSPSFVDRNGKMLGVIQAFVIEAPGKKIVIDCCVGDDKARPAFHQLGWHHSHHQFLDRLASAGIAREEVDLVLCTHLHMDHVGWNTMLSEGRWVPTFPHARYLIARTEFEHLKHELARTPVLEALGMDENELLATLADPERTRRLLSERGLSFEQLLHGALDLTSRQTWADSIAPVIEAGLVDLVDHDHEVCPEIKLIPTNGHTPGHVSVHIRLQGQEALITGDAIHHPVQLAVPELTTVADADPAKGVETRRKLLSSLAGRNAVLIGTHFAAPTAGQVREDGEGFRLWSESK